MAILVTGGAGYIGSHTVAELVDNGEQVVIADNLGQGHRQAAEVLSVPLYHIDIRDSEELGKILRQHNIDTVVHFAANSLVGESVPSPPTVSIRTGMATSTDVIVGGNTLTDRKHKEGIPWVK